MGAAPVGSSRYGFGSPATATPVTGSALKAKDGTQYGSRQISTAYDTRGRYVLGTDGQFVGIPDVQQMIVIALQTVFGSSAVKGLGQKFTLLQKIGPTFQQDVAVRVNEALGDLIKKGFVRLDGVSFAEQQTSRAAIVVNITDLTTKTPYKFTLNGDRLP